MGALHSVPVLHSTRILCQSEALRSVPVPPGPRILRQSDMVPLHSVPAPLGRRILCSSEVLQSVPVPFGPRILCQSTMLNSPWQERRTKPRPLAKHLTGLTQPCSTWVAAGSVRPTLQEYLTCCCKWQISHDAWSTTVARKPIGTAYTYGRATKIMQEISATPSTTVARKQIDTAYTYGRATKIKQEISATPFLRIPLAHAPAGRNTPRGDMQSSNVRETHRVDSHSCGHGTNIWSPSRGRILLSFSWAVLSSTDNNRLSSTMVHTGRCRVALDWLYALFNEFHGPLQRDFPLVEPHADEEQYFITDACPWGFAGVRYKNHIPIAWFASPLSQQDIRRFNASVGDCAHNTTWEALALLVACRIWLPKTKVLARIRSDSLASLRALAKMSSSSAALNLIARELAFDSIVQDYEIGFATHVPGIANILADDLSRMWAPNPHSFPDQLNNVREEVVPARDNSFWRTHQPRQRGGRRKSRQEWA